jgi:hypothetical protein
VSLPSGFPTQFVPGVFATPLLEPGGQAITELIGPDGGLSIAGGYVFLSRLDTDGSAGSFDLVFGDGSPATEIWGTFDAPACP